MKIKNLKINEQAVSALLSATLVIGSITGSVLYYQHENKQQVCKIKVDSTNIYEDENGKFYCYFDVGEHIITVSRNDAYYYKSEEIEGYAIKEVEINGWRDNNKITYINIVPVVVEATKEKNGQFEFNNFGIISTEKNKTKTYTP